MITGILLETINKNKSNKKIIKTAKATHLSCFCFGYVKILFAYLIGAGVWVAGVVVEAGAADCVAGASFFAGTGTGAADGLPVITTLKRIRTIIVAPKVQVAFSMKSLVLCTPNCAEEAPPKVLERPPPLGF